MHDQTGQTFPPAPRRGRPAGRRFSVRAAGAAKSRRQPLAEPLEGRTLFAIQSPVQLAVEPNFNVTRALENQHSPAVAINPNDPANVFIASTFDSRNTSALDNVDLNADEVIDPSLVGDARIGILGSTSFNVGRDYASIGIAEDAITPDAAYDNFGNLFLTYYNPPTFEVDPVTGVITSIGDSSIDVLLSTNNGATFSLLTTFPVTVISDDIFFFGNGEIEVVDSPQPSIATGNGQVWVAYEDFGEIEAIGAPVAGLGAVGGFTGAASVPRSVGGKVPDVAIGPAGQVMVTYQVPRQDPDVFVDPDDFGVVGSGGGVSFLTFGQNLDGPSDIFVNVDPDGLSGPALFGQRFRATITNVGTSDRIPAQNTRNIDAEPGIVYDRSGGAFNGRAWMVYTDESIDRNSNDTDVYVRFSDDDGRTWSSPRRVSDEDFNLGSQFLPRIAMDQSTGNIAVSFYDARDESGVAFGPNDEARYVVTVGRPTNAEAGIAFADNAVVSQGISDPARSRSVVDLGDYTGLDFFNNVVYAAWADNSNSTRDNPSGGTSTGQALATLDVYSARVVVSPTVQAGPERAPVGPGSPLRPEFVGKDTVTKGKSYKFQVRYQSDNGIDAASLGDDDVLVTGPNGYSLPGDFQRAKRSRGGVTATYVAPAPGGVFDAGDNGLYSVLLQPGAVRDLAGTTTNAGLLDQFLVSSTATPQSPALHAAPPASAALTAAADDDDDRDDKLAAVGL